MVTKIYAIRQADKTEKTISINALNFQGKRAFLLYLFCCPSEPPAKRGRGGQRATTADSQEPTPAERRASMTWAQRLKRVFSIDIETCLACDGAVQIIACIEDPVVTKRIPSFGP